VASCHGSVLGDDHVPAPSEVKGLEARLVVAKPVFEALVAVAAGIQAVRTAYHHAVLRIAHNARARSYLVVVY